MLHLPFRKLCDRGCDSCLINNIQASSDTCYTTSRKADMKALWGGVSILDGILLSSCFYWYFYDATLMMTTTTTTTTMTTTKKKSGEGDEMIGKTYRLQAFSTI